MEAVILQRWTTAIGLDGGEVALGRGAGSPAVAVAVREDKSPSRGQASMPVGQPAK